MMDLFQSDLLTSREILKILAMISQLQVKMKKGAVKFSDVKENTRDRLVYDESEDVGYDEPGYKIVADMCIEFDHHDIIGYYDDIIGFPVVLYLDENENPQCVEITLDIKTSIIVYEGFWDVV